MHELLALINEKMWLGHFGMWEDEGLPMFRHALLLQLRLRRGQLRELQLFLCLPVVAPRRVLGYERWKWIMEIYMEISMKYVDGEK